MRGFSEKYKTIFPMSLNNIKYKTLIKLITKPKIPHNCCYHFGFLNLNKMNKIWTDLEKQELMHFAYAGDDENMEDYFNYISNMMAENGYKRTASQCKSMYYRLCKSISQAE